MAWCAHLPTLAGCVRCGRSDHRCATRDGLCRRCAARDRYAAARDGARDRAALLSNARNEGHGWHPQHEHCVGCGTRVLPHHADGYCRACWRAARGLAGAVELWGEADGDVAWTVEG